MGDLERGWPWVRCCGFLREITAPDVRTLSARIVQAIRAHESVCAKAARIARRAAVLRRKRESEAKAA